MADETTTTTATATPTEPTKATEPAAPVKEAAVAPTDSTETTDSGIKTGAPPGIGKEKLIEGKRNMKVRDFEAAIVSFSECLAMQEEAYGSLHLECADTYVQYASALLAKAQATTNVFGGDDDGAEDADMNEGSDLNIAWEVLLLAKEIYIREKKTDKIATTATMLGEVLLENEAFEQAAEAFTTAIDALQRIDAPLRTQASAHYSLGLALQFANDFEGASGEFDKAVTIVDKDIKALTEGESENKEQTIKELTELKSDLEQKKEDVSTMRQMHEQLKQNITAMFTGMAEATGTAATVPTTTTTTTATTTTTSSAAAAGTSGVSATSAQPINDLTSLVRKRKPSESNPSAAAEPKRAKLNSGEPVSRKGKAPAVDEDMDD